MDKTAFLTVRKLLAPYAKHFAVHADDADRYDLEEDLPHSRTMFAYASTSRGGGVRLVFFPLQVFPELRDQLPSVLATRLRSKCVLPLPAITSTERAALRTLFRAGYARVAAQRAMNPARGYYRKPGLDETFAILQRSVGKKATLTRRPKGVLLALPAKAKVPVSLAARRRPAGLVFKTITPAEHVAVRALLA
jgi:hypothetical protein